MIRFGLLVIIIFNSWMALAAIETSRLKGRKIESWYLSGGLDLRLQNEADHGDDNRLNQRMAVKVGLGKHLNDQLSALIEMATASSNRSVRQTLGDQKDPGFARRRFGLQKAFADWHPQDWISLKIGRTPQIHQTVGDSELLFDNTIALEGASVEMQKQFPDWTLDFMGGSHWIRENYDSYYSEEQSDIMVNWGQMAAHSEHWSFGVGFFNFASIQGAAYTDINLDAAPDGNSEDPLGFVKNRYLPKQAFVETRWKWGPGFWRLFSELIINDDTRDPNRAVWAGTGWSDDTLNFQIAYGEIDSDAIPSFIMDTGFADGNTDSKGIALTAAWKISKKWNVELNQYFNRLKKSTEDNQYLLTQIDTKISW